MSEEEVLDPTLQNILNKKTLKWIFVGGKGGVGKTTCSSSLAVQLSKVRENVLIISTDPAHNLSDAFSQKFSSKPSLVNGFTNLWAMEIDSNIGEGAESDATGLGAIQDLVGSVPGIDEAMSFAEVLKQVRSMEFSCIVFDTAPTGHTLRFLSFRNGIGKMFDLKSRFGGMFSQISSMFSMFGGAGGEEGMMDKFESMRQVIEEVNKQFQDPAMTTFIPVCIPEFLSLYETERLIQELVKLDMDVQDIIVNQILYPEDDAHCNLCSTRSKMQQKYLSQIEDLYADFHIVKLPLLTGEVRGLPALEAFSRNLMNAYHPPEPAQRKLESK